MNNWFYDREKGKIKGPALFLILFLLGFLSAFFV